MRGNITIYRHRHLTCRTHFCLALIDQIINPLSNKILLFTYQCALKTRVYYAYYKSHLIRE